MENIKRFTTFYEECKDEFMEHLDGVRIYLQKNNSKFKNLQKEYTKILDNNEKLQNILYGDKVETGKVELENVKTGEKEVVEIEQLIEKFSK